MGRFGELGFIACCMATAALGQTAQLRLVKVAGGFSQPTCINHAGDGSGRLFVVEQAGRIRIVRNGVVAAAPFLDIASRLSCCGERGLLSVAFPPDYADTGRFYVYYTNPSGDIVVARYLVGVSPDAADPASETVLLTIAHRDYPNHNGGQLAFGPDGFLYFGTGDGGSGGDPLGNGQNTRALLGKLLRIDVSGPGPYAVPPSNPFASASGFRPEIWAYGLRNPWRFSFDRLTGDLYIGDVGQNLYEEVDFQPAGDKGGQNYGWNIMEGFHCYSALCNQSRLTPPVAEYDHSAGDCSVTGGFVYRGARFPLLQGTYFYGDACSGRIRGLTRSGGAWQDSVKLQSGLSITAFGQDEAGELYLADYARGDIYMFGDRPSFAAAAVVNAASYEPGLSPGAIVALFGSGLTTASGVVSSGNPLPRALMGTSVRVNGIAAPIFAMASVNGLDQINFQVPYEVPAGGNVTVVVGNNGVDSPAVSAGVLQVQPGIFTIDGVHAAGSQVAGTAVLYATGLGQVDNPPGTGNLAPLSPLSRTLARPLVTIGGMDAPVEFSGLAPLSAGLYQLNVRIPGGLAAGEQDVVVTVAGQPSKPVKLVLP